MTTARNAVASLAISSFVFACSTSPEPRPGRGEGTADGAAEEVPGETCDSGEDDDGDGWVDCSDPDCSDKCRPEPVSVEVGNHVWCTRSRHGAVNCRGGAPARTEPLRVPFETPAERIEIVEEVVCGIFRDRFVRCRDVRSRLPGLGEERPRRAQLRFDIEAPVEFFEPLRDLAVGRHHACAIAQSGRLYCWGANGSGQLGPGAQNDERRQRESFSPVRIPGDNGFRDVAVAPTYTCAVDGRDRIRCFGKGKFGQLGRGRPIPDEGSGAEILAVPEPIESDASFRSVSAGRYHVCGVTSEGGAVCWGRNDRGQLGHGTPGAEGATQSRVAHARPRPVGGDESWAELSVGQSYTCGRTNSGAVRCWGSNRGGVLGDGTGEKRVDPAPLADDSTYDDLDASPAGTCGAAADGSIRCWGAVIGGPSERTRYARVIAEPVPFRAEIPLRRDTHGQKFLLEQTREPSDTLEGFGGFPGCGLWSESGLTCPSAGLVDARGLETLESRNVSENTNGPPRLGAQFVQEGGSATGPPNRASAMPFRVDEISSAGYSVCVVGESGELRCAGDNWYGELGRPVGEGAVSQPERPDVPDGRTWRTVAVGIAHGCAADSQGRAYCWGVNAHGELGDDAGESRRRTVRAAGEYDIRHLAAGLQHTCGRTSDGRIVCWGRDHLGQLGDGAADESGGVDEVGEFDSAETLRAGGFQTCAIDARRELYCWGGWAADYGVSGASVPHPEPREMDVATPVQSVGLARQTGCAISEGGRARCWGGPFGESPRTVGGSTFESVTAAGDYVCLNASNRGLSCFATYGKPDLTPYIGSVVFSHPYVLEPIGVDLAEGSSR